MTAKTRAKIVVSVNSKVLEIDEEAPLSRILSGVLVVTGIPVGIGVAVETGVAVRTMPCNASEKLCLF